MNLLLYETPEELAEAAARDFATMTQEAMDERGRLAVALAGGSTPNATYEVLARDYANELDWSRVHVFFGDERTVPPDHEDSNYRMAYETFLSHVPVGSVYRMRGELPPDEAAAAYEEELRAFFGQVDVPRFDLILCGLGEDGHTLSLFPETAALDVNDRWVVANPVLKLGTTRLTLTIPVLNASRAVTFLVAGESKAEALKEVLEGDADPRAYPAKLVRPESRDLTWMVDRAAARLLKPPL
ncbi:MAG: 6-phosphogluconolactonase [Rubrobacteraceae bacterium]